MKRTAQLPAPHRVGVSVLVCSLALPLGLAGCGGGSGAGRPTAEVSGDGRDGRTPETALHACMDTRSDYQRVAEHRCADGSMPLGGNIQAGGAARSGNIGPGPDGHVLDRYVVPCPEGDVVLFVDMYHCEEENGPLSEAEIDAAIEGLRHYSVAPEDVSPAVVNHARRAADQLGIPLPGCNTLFDYLLPPENELPDWRHLANVYSAFALLELFQYRGEYAAGLSDDRRGELEMHASVAGGLGMVDTYRRWILAGYTNFQHPQLERLAAISREELLSELITRATACRLEAAMPGYQVEVQP